MAFSRSFTDSQGREWTPRINVVTLGEIKKKTGYDLLSFAEKDCFESLASFHGDLIAVCSAVTVAVADQLKGSGVTENEFASELCGSVLGDARNAIFGALADIFPEEAIGAGILDVISKLEDIHEALMQESLKRLSDFDVNSIDIAGILNSITAPATVSMKAVGG